MKLRNIALYSVALVILFAACTKNTDQNQFVQGTLTSEEDFTPEEFSSISLKLGKLHDGVLPSEITEDTEEIDIVGTFQVSADGSFEFGTLDFGNYILILKNGYAFPLVEYILFTVNEESSGLITELVERVPADNYEVAELNDNVVTEIKFVNKSNITVFFQILESSVIKYGPKNVTSDDTYHRNHVSDYSKRNSLEIQIGSVDRANITILTDRIKIPTNTNGERNLTLTVNGTRLDIEIYDSFFHDPKIVVE